MLAALAWADVRGSLPRPQLARAAAAGPIGGPGPGTPQVARLTLPGPPGYRFGDRPGRVQEDPLRLGRLRWSARPQRAAAALDPLPGNRG